MLGGERDDLFPVCPQHRIRQKEDRLRFSCRLLEGTIQRARLVYLDEQQLQASRRRDGLEVPLSSFSIYRGVWVFDHGNAREPRDRLLQQLQPFPGKAFGKPPRQSG